MPNGPVHTAANLGALAGAYLLGTAAGADMTSFMVGGALGTFLITPDLDLSGKVRTNAEKNWGLLGGLWYPLGYFVKHRGITHTFLRGPTLLLIYFSSILLILCAAVYWVMVNSGIHWNIEIPPNALTQFPSVLGG